MQAVTNADWERIKAAGCGWEDQDRHKFKRLPVEDWSLMSSPLVPGALAARIYVRGNCLFAVRLDASNIPADLADDLRPLLA